MESIFERMNPDDHCPECGALLCETCRCGNCGFELEQPLAKVIPLGAVEAYGAPFVLPLSDEPQVA
jgi:hypothetical protein